MDLRSPSGISIGSAVSVALTGVPNTKTDMQTTDTCDIGRNGPHLYCDTMRYDAIRDAILTCARKLA